MTLTNGEWVGTIPAGSAYVIFRIAGGKQEPGQGEAGYLVAGEAWVKSKNVTFTTTVKTSHIDIETGQKVSPDVVTTAEKVTANGTYTTSAVTGKGEVTVPGNATGNYTPGVINVVYFYKTSGEQTTTEPITTEPITTQPVSEDPTGVLIGAVTDGKAISINDVTAIQRHLAGLQTLTGDALKAADCNGDGRVSIKDATLLQKYLANYTDEIGNIGKRLA